MANSSEIHQELKFKGKIIKAFWPRFTVSKFKFCNFCLKTFIKGKPISKKINYQQLFIDRKDNTKLRTIIYKSKDFTNTNSTALIWLHGGGYALSTPEQDYSLIKYIIKETNSVVICPDYTTSIEKPYPAAIDDCYLTLKYVIENSEELGINKNQIFVGGQSAGGGLTCALSLLARDLGEYNISAIFPIYPMIDCDFTNSNAHNDSPVWNTESNNIAWNIYLDTDSRKNVSKYASPSKETNYRNLPPAVTYVGSLDPFYDETLTYFKNLSKAHVPNNLKVFEGCFHGFDIIGKNTSVGKEAREFFIDNYKYAIKKYFKENK